MVLSKQVAEVERQQQHILDTSSQDFHEAIKASLLLKDDMPDLLSLSPLVVSLLGHLRLLGWSAAATVNIERQEGSLFKSNRMSPNLIQLQHQGRKMFEVAENKMMLIEQTIQGLFSPSGTVAVIIDGLRRASAGQQQALQSIEENMESLRTGVKECSKEAKAVEKEIIILQDMAEELELASSNEFVTARRTHKEGEVEQDLLRRDEENINGSMQRLDQALQEAKNNYEAAQSDVKHARDKTGGLFCISCHFFFF
jgi:archaellum component FlaC